MALFPPALPDSRSTSPGVAGLAQTKRRLPILPLHQALRHLLPPPPRSHAPLSDEATSWATRIGTAQTRDFAHGARRKSRQLSTLYSAAPHVNMPGGPFPRPWTSNPPGMTPLQLKRSPSLSAAPSLPILRVSPPLTTTAHLPHPLLPLRLLSWVRRFLFLLSSINCTIWHVPLGSFFFPLVFSSGLSFLFHYLYFNL